MTGEEQALESVGWGSYMRYFLALMPPAFFVAFVLFTLAINALQSVTYYWLGKIGVEGGKLESIPFWWQMRVYAFLGLGMLAVMCVRAVWCAFAVERACNNIHDALLSSMMRCPEVFFDTTPLGRILNRFGGDMAVVDQNLFNSFIQTVTFWLDLLGYVLVIAIDTISFLFIGLPVLGAYYALLLLYQRCARNLQRIENISSTPVLSLFSETVSGAGLSTIRAYHLEDQWRNRFYALNDAWTTRYVLMKEGDKWATMVCSLISTVFMAGVVLLGWFVMDAADLGIAVVAGMIISFSCPSLVFNHVEFGSNMTYIERIFFYSSKLPQEMDKPNAIEPEKGWPREGRVAFENVSFRYRAGLPYVLNDVSLQLRRFEKIGVCGRTGAGKSSLLFVLFRLVELDPALQPVFYDIDTGLPIPTSFDEPPNKGRVLIDDVDISLVRLQRLRQSISIIPQDPTLFTGTVRSNLDLASRCTDERIWEVLDMIEMRPTIAKLAEGLDSEVAEGGSNFSCGQRQLLCFARAILNDCRIVIMDEATANIDMETDTKIQNTIRNQFKSQTTLVIAHRLNTVLHSDRILVMEAGRVAEFDTPQQLQAKPDSAFNALLHSLTGGAGGGGGK